MRRFILPAIAVTVMGLFAVSCLEDDPSFVAGDSEKYKQAAEEASGGSGSGGGTIVNSGGLTADNHPRVIFTDNDFASIVEMVESGTNSYLTTIHNQIISKADGYVSASELTQKYDDAIRMTSVCYTAEMRILCCAYAYKVTGESKYLTRAETDLQKVCSFTDWNNEKQYLDVGEMSIGVGLGYDWLYNDLSSSTKSAVRTALNDFAFTPALTGKMSNNIYTLTNNWNQICNAGLVCSALAVYEDNSTTAQTIIDNAVTTNIYAQQVAYSPDGNYPEGYLYYAYGTLFEVTMLAAMETAVGTDYGLSDVDGFTESSDYMIFMEGPTGYYFNYGDSERKNGPCLPQWYFAWKYGQMSALYLEKDRIDSYSSEVRLLPIIAWFASKLNVSSIPAPTENIYHGDGEEPVVIIHDTWTMDENEKFLGIKGGYANGNHSHLDVGSFVFDAEGIRWCWDYGRQDYATLETYLPNVWNYKDGSDRWSVFRFNNKNHNTLTINDSDHLVDGFGSFTDVFYDKNGKKGATMDMSELFDGSVSSVTRSVYIEGDDLFVEDRIVALSNKSATVRWTMVTQASPTIEYGFITLKQSNKTRYLSFSGASVSPTTWTTVGENTWDADNSGYYECGYTLTVSAGSSVTVTSKLSTTDPLD